MLTTNLVHGKTGRSDVPVELRFVDMLLIIIATLMFVAVLLTMASAFAGGSRISLALRITTRSAPTALTGQPYQLRLAAQGGDGSYSWRIAAGNLPRGLFLISDGTVTGIPARAGLASTTIEVVDGQQRSARQQLLFNVRASGARTAPRIAPPHVLSYAILLPEAVNGRPYHYDLAAAGGIPPYHWTLAAGRLPSGLYLTDQGNVTGQPQQSGSATITVRIADSAGRDVTQRVTLIVRDAPPAIWQSALQWLKTIATVIGLIVLLMIIGNILKLYFFGRKPATIPGIPSRRQRRERASR